MQTNQQLFFHKGVLLTFGNAFRSFLTYAMHPNNEIHQGTWSQHTNKMSSWLYILILI